MVAVDDKRPQITCRFVVFGTGSLTKPYVPAFPKLDELAGQVIYPRHWPDGLDVRGKGVGIIGQGATGLQIVQELAKQDCKMSVFIRSQCIAVPMRQRSLSFEETEQMKNLYKGIFFKAKYSSASALPYNQSCDVVVFATGYDSLTGSLFDMNIYDKDGVWL
ncbi:Baeyer-Villiger monooxygenase [Colletotrichum viniferum]|nr:Baeyer-Villiger monooxygenase [Colletotrichum viniferum]